MDGRSDDMGPRAGLTTEVGWADDWKDAWMDGLPDECIDGI